MKNFNNYGNGGAIVTDDVNLLDFATKLAQQWQAQHMDMIGYK
jgi:hypothetical protein